ncbi:hypothetical protein GWN63_01275 [Candidatus Bathyarchaeota archaeon]|nr:hypothetical protein [Candidatus Bathyarchaeota archaeon]NIR12714.1 hypothetical protein [Desulfobacterales bacterium]NIU80868.1 hypothetical protein [Candidatus Bathyarchaeota archaeon]NIV67798.1 hypothetical protein [Candidatus Bathyarchaeota archaeon]NIW34206.1 hypothetical protein [Candidatus Bathyarchaeota archaeon]
MNSKLLDLSLREIKKRYAISRYRRGKSPLWKAAQTAGITLREMMDIIKEERIPVHISPEEVEEGWGKALEAG